MCLLVCLKWRKGFSVFCLSNYRSGTFICFRAALGTCGFVELGQELSLVFWNSVPARFSSRLELS